MRPVVLKGDAVVGYSIFVLCEDEDGVSGGLTSDSQYGG